MLAIVVLTAGAAFLVVSKFLAPQDTAAPQEEKPAAKEVKHKAEKEKAKVKAKAKAKAKAKEEESGQGEIFMVEGLLVNPTGTSGMRYLSASLALEVAEHEVIERLEEKKLQIRDLLITILSSRTVDELTTVSERERMRKEIAGRLNQLLAPDKIRAVYFVDYVLQ